MMIYWILITVIVELLISNGNDDEHAVTVRLKKIYIENLTKSKAALNLSPDLLSPVCCHTFCPQ